MNLSEWGGRHPFPPAAMASCSARSTCSICSSNPSRPLLSSSPGLSSPAGHYSASFQDLYAGHDGNLLSSDLYAQLVSRIM
ncbi:MAG: hypothetical protein GY696_03705 [Gammaproteobacteria bacterium]|nr:hypothetical protein [Gammaproteobacteria bacterium]